MVQMEREREEALRRAGVSLIVRFTYDDVIERVPLVNKLLRVGIPRTSPQSTDGDGFSASAG